jgi:hypothetical protein
MDLARARVGVLERVEKGDEAVATCVPGSGGGLAAVDDVLEQGNLVGGGLGVARGGLDDLECDMGVGVGVVGEPDSAKVAPSARALAAVNAKTLARTQACARHGSAGKSGLRCARVDIHRAGTFGQHWARRHAV